MKPLDFATSLLVDEAPEEVFKAITNARGWWSEEIEGNTEKLNDEFVYHFEDVHYSRMKLTEVVPDKKIVWLVQYNYFKFTKDKSEWTGTSISFEISRKDGKTQLTFTHHGLTPEFECFSVCNNAWTQYIRKSLYNLIVTGKGQPNATGKPTTQDEKDLSASRK